MRAKINEVFVSLQGEVPGIGQPAIFVRFTGCNLKCEWCDTKYAFKEGLPMDSEQLRIKILKLAKQYNINWVIFTGGEPTLNLKFLQVLCPTLKAEGLELFMETNGTIDVPFKVERHFTQIVVSPKVINDSYFALMQNHVRRSDTIVKLVHTTDEEVMRLMDFYAIPDHKVVIMPLGATREEMNKNLKRTWKFCMVNSLRMGFRLHIETFDMKRGV